MSSLPIRRKDFDVAGFLSFIAKSGGEVMQPTNPYEVVRYRAYWRGTNKASVYIVYAKENGLLTFTNGSHEHYRAFLSGTDLETAAKIEGPRATQAEQMLPRAKRTRAQMRAALLERDGDSCWFCGTAMGDDCTIEHLIARARGGGNSMSNYALAHQRCNANAADLPLVEKIAMRARMRRQDA